MKHTLTIFHTTPRHQARLTMTQYNADKVLQRLRQLQRLATLISDNAAYNVFPPCYVGNFITAAKSFEGLITLISERENAENSENANLLND